MDLARRGALRSLARCLAVVALGAAACTSGGPSDGSSGGPSGASTSIAQTACDPLSVEAPPIALGVLVGAGRASDGTVYVIDRDTSRHGELRAFVSDGTALRRRKVWGAGETSSFVTVMLDADPTAPLQVRVDVANGNAVRMGVFRGAPDPASKSFEIGGQGEELTLLTSADLASFTLVNTSSILVTYAATSADGHRFMMFEPEVDRSDENVRVFYGTDDRMLERKVLSIARSSFVRVDLDLDGVRTTAILIHCLSAPSFGPARLEPQGGASVVLTPVSGSGPDDCSRSRPAELDAGDASDGGDAGAPAPLATPEALVAGLGFYCF